MHPWLFDHPPISTYGTCIVLAIAAAWMLARLEARRRNFDASHVDLLVPLLMATGMAGAWAFGWWTDQVTDDAAHGIVLAGALVGGTLTGIGYAVMNRMPLGVLGDVFAAPVALAIAGGRVGCFFAGCCYGKVCGEAPWAVHFPAGSLAFVDQVKQGVIFAGAGESLAVFPVQLFESGGCLLLAMILVVIAGRIRGGRGGVNGEAFLSLGVGYALLRFALEFFRADNPPVLGWLTFSQVASILIFIAASATWWIRRRFAIRWGLQSSQAGSLSIAVSEPVSLSPDTAPIASVSNPSFPSPPNLL